MRAAVDETLGHVYPALGGEAASVLTIDQKIETLAAASTLFAGLVALSVPFVLDWRQRSRVVAERARVREIAYREVCFAVDKALWSYIRLRRELVVDHLTAHLASGFRRHGREAQSTGLVLEHLVRQHALGDDVLRCALEGVLLAKETRDAAEQAAASWLDEARDTGDAAFERARDALLRCNAIRHRYGLQRSRNNPVPELDHHGR